VHLQERGLAVGRGVHLADERVVVKHGQREVPPASLVLQFVHLQEVLEVEQLRETDMVVDQWSNGESSAVRPSKPLAVASGSTRHRPDVPSTSAGTPASPTTFGRATPRDRSRFSSRTLRAVSTCTTAISGWVDPLGQVPQALPASASSDGHLPE
jgi:hypothetical protein